GPCATYHGDGKIHNVGPSGGADILTIADPYGACGRGVGAMKFDAALTSGGHLWIESYLPTLNGVIVDNFGASCLPSVTNCTVEVSELNAVTGVVLASCELPFRGGGVGSDT